MASKLSEQQIFDILLESDVEGMSDDEDDMEEQIGLDLEEETTSELFDEEEPSIPEVLQQTQNRKFKWFSKNFTNSSDCPDELEWDVENRQMWTPYNYFCEYFNDDFWSLVSEKSNMYAHQNNNRLNATPSEYKKLVGAHIIAGCMKLPRIRMYYRPQIKVPAITQIPRDRLFKLRNAMHFVDNMSVTEEDKKDKLWRIRPVLDVLLGKCRSIPKPNKCSIDEQMIPFSGKTSPKQYVKGKPNPVGLKNFVLASTDGLRLDFFKYQWANTWPDGKPDKYLGIGGTVVKKLSTHLNKGCEIYIDRYFTSIAILEYLLDKGIFATGTIQLNRVPKELRAKLSNDKALLKKGRGSFEEFIREDDKMCIVKWMDSRSVLIASTSSGSHPLQSARRWDKVGRKYINIDCPNAILRYNQCMGGVDLADRYVSYYRIAIRTKKWPLKVFWHFVDVAACNSWILYKRDKYACGENKKNIMDLLDFKFYIAECLIADATIDKEGESSSDIEYEPPTKKVKRKVKPLPPKDVRTTQNKHLPICAVSDKNKFMRCRKEGCNQKTRFKCISCDIFLCINNDRHCFMEFHS